MLCLYQYTSNGRMIGWRSHLMQQQHKLQLITTILKQSAGITFFSNIQKVLKMVVVIPVGILEVTRSYQSGDARLVTRFYAKNFR